MKPLRELLIEDNPAHAGLIIFQKRAGVEAHPEGLRYSRVPQEQFAAGGGFAPHGPRQRKLARGTERFPVREKHARQPGAHASGTTSRGTARSAANLAPMRRKLLRE